MGAIFYLHASLSVLAMGLAMLTSHAVHALLYAVVSLLCMAVSMYSMQAHLAAALEVIVYAGAIMVLFVFAVMFLRIGAERPKQSFSLGTIVKSFLIFALFWADLVYVVKDGLSRPQAHHAPGIEDIARSLFGQYGFLVEIVSFVLLAGLATAIFVARGTISQNSVAEVVHHDSH